MESVDDGTGTTVGDECETDPVRDCVEALRCLSLPLDAGAPKAHAALRASRHRFGNGIVAGAIKAPDRAEAPRPGRGS
jgi:hypothetical protein